MVVSRRIIIIVLILKAPLKRPFNSELEAINQKKCSF